MPYKNIVVVGGGAIGGITAASLILKGENVIVVDADREHVAKMNKGLEVAGGQEFTVPVKAVMPSDFSVARYAKWADIVLLAVKGLHTENALRSILAGVSEAAPVVSLQNGINEESIAKIVGEARTIGCSITWGGTNMGPGQLIQTTKEGGFIIGQWPTGESKIVEETAVLLSKAFPTEITKNIIGDRWTKLLLTVSLTGVGTTLGLTYGESVANEDAVKVVLAVISETLDVGKAAGVEFADWKQPGSQMGISPLMAQVRKKEDLANATMIMQLGWSIPIKPSMWQDIEKGRKTEVDFVNGYVVRKGQQVHLKTPANELVTRLVHEIEDGKKSPDIKNLVEYKDIVAHLQ
jgi:2-dehydropantoate 2-reductase